MDLGGIVQEEAPRVFLISTTHGAETHALAAGRAVLREYQRYDVVGHQKQIVKAVTEGFSSVVEKYGLGHCLEIHTSGWRLICICRDRNGDVSPVLRTLLMQEMIGRGVLFTGYFLPCFEHTEEDVEQIVQAFEHTCQIYQQGLEAGVDALLVGEVTRPVFRKYNKCMTVCPSVPCPFEKDCLA
jgi:glutamate-1-semialdehyde aminotransferase